MAQSKASSVAEYLQELPPDRRAEIEAVRKVIRKHLPQGFREGMANGMIGYCIPLDRFSGTSNKQPLPYAALAAQKNYNALYLMCAYTTPGQAQALKDGFAKAGKKLDMGKSCIRFKRAEDLPLDVIGKAIASTTPDEFIAIFEKAHAR